jgi:hypothetical protein
MTTKYIARLNNEIVGKRTSKDRVYTHAIVIRGHGKGPHVRSWAGSLQLAQKACSQWTNYGYSVEIVPAEIVPSNARTAKALNDSGVFAPLTVIGTD